MKRISTGARIPLLLLALVAMLLGGLATNASAAPAQDSNACFPGTDPDYPPVGPSVQIDLNLTLLVGQFNPGASGHIEIGGAQPNVNYCGVAFSTPITLPAKQANAQGKLIYDIAVPADFELGAMHHIDVYKQQVKVGNFDFCVNKSGALAPNSQ